MERIFGIDLGTTNSVIAYTDPTGTTEVIAGQDGSRIVPSVIYFPKDGARLVGKSARQHAMLFKRGMPGRPGAGLRPGRRNVRRDRHERGR